MNLNEIKIFSKDFYDKLKLEIGNNRNEYLKSKSFVYEKYHLNQKDYIPKVNLKKPMGDQKFELENSKVLYNSLLDLDMSIIINKRFWTTLSHTYYYDYLQKRIPTPKKKSNQSQQDYAKLLDKHISDHYFREGRNSRHMLSGLWWRTHVTYDEDLENPFEYTEKLYALSDRDLMNAMIENTLFIKYPILTKALLDVIETIDYNRIKGSRRNFNRKLATLINLEGSTRLLNVFKYDDYIKLIKEMVHTLKKSQ